MKIGYVPNERSIALALRGLIYSVAIDHQCRIRSAVFGFMFVFGGTKRFRPPSLTLARTTTTFTVNLGRCIRMGVVSILLCPHLIEHVCKSASVARRL